MKLKYNMLKNAKRDLKRELMLENGYRRKSSEQMAKEKRKISDNYKVMSSTHKGIGIDVYSCEYVSVNQFESKFKTSSRDILSIETNYNNVAAYEKNLETEELFEELLESDCLNEEEKKLMLDLILLDQDSISKKEGISKEALKKRVYRLKIKIKSILQKLKEDSFKTAC